MGALQVFVMPTVAISVGGSYSHFNPAGSNNAFRVASVLGQIAWMPVSGFQIGAEATYRSLSFDSGSTRTAVSGTKKSEFVGRLRVQRDF